MITYKQCKDHFCVISKSVVQRLSDSAFIPTDEANTDYRTFKNEIIADAAILQDAEGNNLTPEQAKDFVKELP